MSKFKYIVMFVITFVSGASSHANHESPFDQQQNLQTMCSTMMPSSHVPPDNSNCWQWFTPPQCPPYCDPNRLPSTQIGCDYKPCQDAVCECDPYCCNKAWDLSCRGYLNTRFDDASNGCSAKILCCEPESAYPKYISEVTGGPANLGGASASESGSSTTSTTSTTSYNVKVTEKQKTTHVNNNVVYTYSTGKGKGKGGGASTVQYVTVANGAGKGKGGGTSTVQYVTVANGAGKGKGAGTSNVQYVAVSGMGKKGGGMSAVHYVTGTQTTQNIFTSVDESIEYVNVPIHAQAQTSATKTSVIYYGNRRKR